MPPWRPKNIPTVLRTLVRTRINRRAQTRGQASVRIPCANVHTRVSRFCESRQTSRKTTGRRHGFTKRFNGKRIDPVPR